MADCFQTNIAEVPLVTDTCEGKLTSTTCVIHETAITYLDLPANATQEEINNALVLSLQDTRNRLATAEEQILDLESRVEALENP